MYQSIYVYKIRILLLIGTQADARVMNAPARHICHVAAKGSEAWRATGLRLAVTSLGDRNIDSPWLVSAPESGGRRMQSDCNSCHSFFVLLQLSLLLCSFENHSPIHQVRYNAKDSFFWARSSGFGLGIMKAKQGCWTCKRKFSACGTLARPCGLLTAAKSGKQGATGVCQCATTALAPADDAWAMVFVCCGRIAMMAGERIAALQSIRRLRIRWSCLRLMGCIS